jgi:excinuclease ABC subunit A
LVDQGNTVLVIEHNLDVIKTADWLIDMGPEGGKRGGTLVAAGTPEDVAADPASYTGQFLAPLLEGRSRTTKASRRPAGPRQARPPETPPKAPAKKAAKQSAKKTAAASGRTTKGQASARASAGARGSRAEGSSASSQRTPSKRKAAS